MCLYPFAFSFVTVLEAPCHLVLALRKCSRSLSLAMFSIIRRFCPIYFSPIVIGFPSTLFIYRHMYMSTFNDFPQLSTSPCSAPMFLPSSAARRLFHAFIQLPPLQSANCRLRGLHSSHVTSNMLPTMIFLRLLGDPRFCLVFCLHLLPVRILAMCSKTSISLEYRGNFLLSRLPFLCERPNIALVATCHTTSTRAHHHLTYVLDCQSDRAKDRHSFALPRTLKTKN